ncbi:MAG: histidine kinase [Rhodocyclales bacterium]|nr:histidine kinase [Rhodocyclales bacterium]
MQPKQIRVLIIEDHVDSAQTMQVMLTVMGYHADVAHDGLIGLHMAIALLPDIIICDIGLPELDGYGVAAGLRAHKATSTIPVIAVTAYGEEVRGTILESGFLMHFVKPVDPRVLQGAISVYAAS